MKFTRVLPGLGLASLLFLPASLSVEGAVIVWQGVSGTGGAGNWLNPDHWVGGVVPTSADDAEFTQGTGNVGLGNFLRSAAKITFTSGSGAYTINSGSTSPQGLSVGSGGIINNSSATQTFGNASTYSIATTASQSWQAVSGDLSFSTAVNLGANTLTLNAGASRTITLGGTISGTGGLSKSGAGTMVVTGASSYSGATALSAGTLRYEVDQVFSGALNLSGGNLDQNDRFLSFDSMSLLGSTTLTLGTDLTSQNIVAGSATWTAGTLTVENWSPSATSDKLFIAVQPSAALLNNINFTGFGSGATWLQSGEIVPVPEPETYTIVAGVALLGVAAVRRHLRRR